MGARGVPANGWEPLDGLGPMLFPPTSFLTPKSSTLLTGRMNEVRTGFHSSDCAEYLKNGPEAGYSLEVISL